MDWTRGLDRGLDSCVLGRAISFGIIDLLFWKSKTVLGGAVGVGRVGVAYAA